MILDAATVTTAGNFLSHELNRVWGSVLEKRRPAMWGQDGVLIPTSYDLQVGDRNLIEQVVETVGEAVIMDNATDDIPVADFAMSSSTLKTFRMVSSLTYDIFDLATEAAAGKSLNTLRLSALAHTFAEKAHKIALFGSSKHNVKGFLNNANVTVVNASSYDADGSGVTADDHIAFISTQIGKIMADSNLTEGASTILVPAKLYSIWLTSRLSGTSTTVINFLLDSYINNADHPLKSIRPINELTAAVLEANGVQSGGTNKDRLVLYTPDPELVERKAYPMQTLAPEIDGFGFKVNAHEGCSQVKISYPGSMLYVDIPKIP